MCVFCFRYTRLYLLLMGVSVLIRPTGVILWPPLVLAHYVMDRSHLVQLLRETVTAGCVCVRERIIKYSSDQENVG